MTTYRITFFGRLVGSLGITYHNVAEIKAASKEEAVRELYKTYEHIGQIHLSEWADSSLTSVV